MNPTANAGIKLPIASVKPYRFNDLDQQHYHRRPAAILWSHGAELTVYPAINYLWRARGLKRGDFG
ncbi:MAG TPA: hypothetical protein VF607_08005 [Verrucomicrobiae bacterium]